MKTEYYEPKVKYMGAKVPMLRKKQRIESRRKSYNMQTVIEKLDWSRNNS